ncbi:MAG: hypothetical protein KF724_13210 [Phycisphaeraceae bacterium]|nr:hypothetical protein [Phycisphaeraceae bacterium]
MRLLLSLTRLHPLLLVATAVAQVEVKLERYGVGDRWRSGDFVGIQVSFTSDLSEPTPVRVEWSVPDANGDMAEYSRSLVLNPRQSATRWLYGRLPPMRSVGISDEFITLIRVFEERDGRRVRELASQRIKASDAQVRPMAVSIEDDLVGIVGAGRMGLDGYEPVASFGDRPVSLNTATMFARGIQPRDLPDRWEGLFPYQALIWSEGSPAALSAEQSEALRTWIRRGGHLVIVLPEAGNPWTLGSATAHGLSALLPSQMPQRLEGTPVASLLPILSKSDSLRVEDATVPIQVFDPSRLDRGFVPLLALPSPRDSATGELAPRPGTLDGAVVAVQAMVGHGRISLIGIDVDGLHRRRLQAGDLPQADVFWNCVLGRRGDTPTAAELQGWADSEPRRLSRGQPTIFAVEGALVSGRIGLRGQAALGLLGVLALFATYWVVAGPAAWVVLGKLRQRQLTWLVFVGVALLFSGIAWGASRLMSEREPRVQHVTVLDWIARGPHEPPSTAPRLARAVSWFSAALPGYGAAEITVDRDSGERNLLTIWSPPPSGSTLTFPNPSRYEVPIDSPGSIEVPSRATSSEFEVHWMGALNEQWGALPAGDGASTIEPVLEWIVDPRVGLRGSLIHRLPSDLSSVRIIHVQPFRTPRPRLVTPPARATDRRGARSATEAPLRDPLPEIDPSGNAPNYGRYREVPLWPAGTPLDLSSVLYPNGPAPPSVGTVDSLQVGMRERYYARVAASGLIGGVSLPEFDQYDLLSFYWWLQPPEYMARPEPQLARVLRTLGRTIDLSPWSNRPCLVIVGYLANSPLPIPIEIGGRRPPSNGLTIVRIVVPLPSDTASVLPFP